MRENCNRCCLLSLFLPLSITHSTNMRTGSAVILCLIVLFVSGIGLDLNLSKNLPSFVTQPISRHHEPPLLIHCTMQLHFIFLPPLMLYNSVSPQLESSVYSLHSLPVGCRYSNSSSSCYVVCQQPLAILQGFPWNSISVSSVDLSRFFVRYLCILHQYGRSLCGTSLAILFQFFQSC